RAAVADLGPGEIRLVRLLAERSHAWLEEVGAAHFGRRYARATEAHLHLSRPARDVRDHDEASPDARGHAHRTRRTQGAIHLRRPARTGDARRGVLREPRNQAWQSSDAVQSQRAGMGHDLL